MIKNKMKSLLANDNGSALVFVVMVLFVSVVLGTSILSVNSAENMETIRQDHSLHAYYLAKSGAEAMAKTIVDNSKSMTSANFQTFLNTIKDQKSGKTYVGSDGGYFEVEIVSDADKGLGVVSTGTMRQESETVTVWLTGGSQSLSSEIDFAVFSDTKITMEGSCGIVGDTYSNVDDPSNITALWNNKFYGNLYVTGSGTKNWNSVKNQISGSSYKLYTDSPTKTFTMPEFPTFPTLTNKGNFSTNSWQEFHIQANNYYPNITVSGSATLYIDTNNQDCSIVCDSLSVSGSNGIKINGTGTVRLYIRNSFNISGSVGVTTDINNLMIYFAGSSFSMGGATKINGSLFAKTASIDLNGSGSITGIVATGGTTVNVSGGYSAQGIYAPNANVNISVSTNGPVIGKTLKLTGASTVTYHSLSGTGFDKLFFSSSSTSYEIGSWE